MPQVFFLFHLQNIFTIANESMNHDGLYYSLLLPIDRVRLPSTQDLIIPTLHLSKSHPTYALYILLFSPHMHTTIACYLATRGTQLFVHVAIDPPPKT